MTQGRFKHYKKGLFTATLVLTTALSSPVAFAETTNISPSMKFASYYQSLPNHASNLSISKNVKPQLQKDKSKAPSMDISSQWIPVGSSQGDKKPETPDSGRVSSIAIKESKQGTTLYAGTANGGVWSSTDGNHWKAMTDDQDTLSTGSVTVDPRNPNVLYVGTGEQHFSADSRYGRGILKSTDGGKTWTLLGSDVFGGIHIGKIAVDPFNSSNLWVAADNGLWQSTDGGQTWDQWYSGEYDIWPLGHAETPTDVYLDAHTQGVIYMSLNSGGLFKSTDGGQNFMPVGDANILPNYINDITAPGYHMNSLSFAVVEGKTSATDTLYAAYTDTNGELIGIYVSKDGGDTWSKLDQVPQYFDINFSFTGKYDSADAFGQGTYDNVIAVDPTDSKHILAGGVTLIESRDGGQNWTVLDTFSDKTHSPVSMLHPAQHAITFDSKGNAYIGNDGGIFEETAKGKWLNLNSGLNTLMLNPGLSTIDQGKTILVGSQENGTLMLTHDGQWTTIYGGSGGYTYIDPQNPQVKFVESQYGNIVRQTDPAKDGNVWIPSSPGYVNNYGQYTAQFLTPFTVRPLSGKQQGSYELIVGSGCVARSYDNGVTYEAISPNFTYSWSSDPVVTVSQSHTDPNIVYAGTIYGQVYVSFNAESSNPQWTNITPFNGDWQNGSDPATSVSAIAINPNNPKEITVTFGNPGAYAPWSANHVYWTSDTSSPTWTNVTGNLPYAFALSATYMNNALVVGTEQGVYIAKPGTANWSKLGSDLPNAPVTSLTDAGNGLLIAGTYGRGAYKLQLGPEAAKLAGDK